MKKILIVFMLVMSVSAFWACTADGQTISIGTANGVPGGTVSLPVTAQSLTDICGFQWTIEYDETQLSFSDIDSWDAGVNQSKLTVNGSTPGVITVAYNDYPNGFDIADATFFNINFTVNTGASGTTNVIWSDSPTTREVSNSVPNIISVTWNTGSVTIDTSPVIDILEVTGVPGSPVTVPVTAQNLVDITAFQWTLTYDDALLTFDGTSNWDAEINSADVTINDDGAGTITFVYSEYPATFNIVSGTFFDLNFTVKVGASGTANLAWSDSPTARIVSNAVPAPISPSWEVGSVSINSSPTISIADVTGTPGAAVSVPVYGQNLTDITAFQWTVLYDPAILSYTGTSNWDAQINSADVTINDDGAGTIIFAYNEYPASFSIADGTFFDLNFDVAVGAYGTTDISWSDVPRIREVSNSTPSVITVNWVDGSVSIGSTWTGAVDSDWLTAGNWNPAQVPASTDNVYIPDVSPNDFPVVDDASITVIKCNNLIIDAGAVLTIATNGEMTVSGTITNNNGTGGIIIESDMSGTGSLILNNTGVQGTFQQFLSHVNGEDGQWHFTGSPVTSAPASIYGAGNFYEYAESADDWWTGTTYFYNTTSGWAVPSGNLSPGKGYIKYSAETTVNFQGEFNYSDGDIIVTIPYTEHPGSSGEAPNGSPYTNYDGWVLVSNPYQSAIDWLKVQKSSGLNMSVYYYDDNGDNYIYYTDNGDGTGFSLNGGSQYIPAGQGFFVKAGDLKSGTITIPNTARAHSSQALWKNNTKPILHNEIRISLTHEGRTDESGILFRSHGQTDFSDRFDVYKRFSWDESMPQIYSLSGDDQVRTALKVYGENEGVVIPLGFKAGETGDYSIQFSDMDISGFDYAILEDLHEQKFYNATQAEAYTFTSEPGMIEERFLLHINNNSAPQISEPIPNLSHYAESEFYLSAEHVFTDTDIADQISLEATLSDGSSLPQWLSFDTQTGVFFGTPENPDAGIIEIMLTATDSYGESNTEIFELEILYLNHAPYLNNAPDPQMMPAGRLWSFQLPEDMFADEDPSDQLTYTAQIPDPLIGYLTFDPESLNFSGALPKEYIGEYELLISVSDPFGASADYNLELSVLSPLVIIQHPQDERDCKGEQVVFSVEASGTNLQYQWFYNEQPIEGASQSQLIISDIDESKTGEYRCRVSDVFGSSDTESAYLDLLPGTEFVLQPLSEYVIDTGGTLTIEIAANGSNLSYQWFKDMQAIENDARISGSQTAQLTIYPVSAEDAGTYELFVSGDCGELFSEPAQLTVPTGIKALNGQEFMLYPNPANDFIIIESELYADDFRIMLHDVTGREIPVNNEHFQQKAELDIRHLSAGIYFISVEYSHLVIRKMFVKQ